MGNPFIRPGDVLVFAVRESLTMEDAERMKAQLMAQMPGIADVILLPWDLQAVFRQSDENPSLSYEPVPLPDSAYERTRG